MKRLEYLPLSRRRVLISLVAKQRNIGGTLDAAGIAGSDWPRIALAAKRIFHVPDAIVASSGAVKDWSLLAEYTDPRRAVLARLDRGKKQPKPKKENRGKRYRTAADAQRKS